MKKTMIISVLLVSAAILFAGGQQENNGTYGGGRGKGMGNGQGRGNSAGNLNGGVGRGYDNRFSDSVLEMLAGIEKGDLSPDEIDGLLLMIEEEKLARDVYAELFTVWNYPIFQNIGGSEQQHMDAVKILLDSYGIPDPVGNDIPGTFRSQELQELYDGLVAEGKKSLGAALGVGATIEDLDIADLQDVIGETDNDDLKILYQNLMKGSRNHMRSFNRLLEREEIAYQAQYISPEYLDRILNVSQEMEPISDPDYIL
jgi:hypothetical protein